MGFKLFSQDWKSIKLYVTTFFSHVTHEWCDVQRNHSFQREIWNGFSSVQGIESTRMDQEQIEQPKLDTGKPQEKTEKLCVTLLLHLLLVTGKLWFFTVEELL